MFASKQRQRALLQSFAVVAGPSSLLASRGRFLYGELCDGTQPESEVCCAWPAFDKLHQSRQIN